MLNIMTLNIMTLSIMILSIMILSIMILSIMILGLMIRSIMTLYMKILSFMTLRIMILSTMKLRIMTFGKVIAVKCLMIVTIKSTTTCSALYTVQIFKNQSKVNGVKCIHFMSEISIYISTTTALKLCWIL
jgi:hypothetical protein